MSEYSHGQNVEAFQPSIIDETKHHISEGFEHSTKHGFNKLKVQRVDGSWVELGQFLVFDLYRIPISNESRLKIIEYAEKLEAEFYGLQAVAVTQERADLPEFLPAVQLPKQPKKTERVYDYRELAAGQHKDDD